MARSLALVLVLLLLLSTVAVAEEVRLPKPILDEKDLSIHVIETSCNSYLITCKQTGDFVLVDPGPRLGGTFTAWKRTGHTSKGIWITHEHGDHLSGLRELLTRTTVPVFAHALARDAVQKMLPQSRGLPGTEPGKPAALRVQTLEDGSTLQVGKTQWKALHLPGHAPGSVGYLLPGRVLVAGDVLFKGSVGRTDLRGSDPEAFAKALGTKLWPLPDEIVVLPGHGPHTTMGLEKKTNRLFQDLARRGRGEAPVARPWIGIQLDQAWTGAGLRLTEIVPGSPAVAMGLQAGDVLLTFGGTSLRSPQDLLGAIGRYAIGDTVPVTWLRGTERLQGTLTLSVRPTQK